MGKALSEAERAVYGERAEKAAEQYKEASAAYEESNPKPVERTPEKRMANKRQSTPNSKPAKRARVCAAPTPGLELDASTLAEAEKAGMKGSLENLSRRADVIAATGLDGAKLLSALIANGGLVNKAKHALLGA